MYKMLRGSNDTDDFFILPVLYLHVWQSPFFRVFVVLRLEVYFTLYFFFTAGWPSSFSTSSPFSSVQTSEISNIIIWFCQFKKKMDAKVRCRYEMWWNVFCCLASVARHRIASPGAEYSGYGSDLTRSYPVNGKFTADQVGCLWASHVFVSFWQIPHLAHRIKDWTFWRTFVSLIKMLLFVKNFVQKFCSFVKLSAFANDTFFLISVHHIQQGLWHNKHTPHQHLPKYGIAQNLKQVFSI